MGNRQLRTKGGAELPLPALRRQAPRWAVGQGVGWVPQGSLPDPARLGPKWDPTPPPKVPKPEQAHTVCTTPIDSL
jgi:hypothetical protein